VQAYWCYIIFKIVVRSFQLIVYFAGSIIYLFILCKPPKFCTYGLSTKIYAENFSKTCTVHLYQCSSSSKLNTLPLYTRSDHISLLQLHQWLLKPALYIHIFEEIMLVVWYCMQGGKFWCETNSEFIKKFHELKCWWNSRNYK